MKLAITLVLLALVGAYAYSEVEYQSMFTSWMKEHGKRYDMNELFNRFNVWKSNLDEIERRNKLGRSFTLGMNHFGDLTSEEFKEMYVGKMTLNATAELNIPSDPKMLRVANDVDWRASAVASVKNQGQCGSCWSFSAAGAIEGYGAIHGQGLRDLAPQELVDCDTGDNGCNGGLPSNAMRYAIQNRGLNSWTDYPYSASKQSCKKKTQHYDGFNSVRTCSGESGIASCMTSGPVSVAIEADKTDFQYYRGGVFDSTGCGTSIDHAVLAVGMVNYQGKDVWVVKNSWGSGWGAGGYIYMVRGKNMCGISNSYACIPQ